MERRRLPSLLLAGFAVLAGCSGLPGGPPDGPAAGLETDTATPQPTPRAFPGRPAELDTDAVTSLAVGCERALVWNERVAAREGVVDLEFEAVAGDVTSTGDGRWVVNLSVDATVVYVEPMDELVGHRYRVTYVVDGETTRRTNVTGRTPVPLPEGTIESC